MCIYTPLKNSLAHFLNKSKVMYIIFLLIFSINHALTISFYINILILKHNI